MRETQQFDLLTLVEIFKRQYACDNEWGSNFLRNIMIKLETSHENHISLKCSSSYSRLMRGLKWYQMWGKTGEVRGSHCYVISITNRPMKIHSGHWWDIDKWSKWTEFNQKMMTRNSCTRKMWWGSLWYLIDDDKMNRNLEGEFKKDMESTV